MIARKGGGTTQHDVTPLARRRWVEGRTIHARPAFVSHAYVIGDVMLRGVEYIAVMDVLWGVKKYDNMNRLPDPMYAYRLPSWL